MTDAARRSNRAGATPPTSPTRPPISTVTVLLFETYILLIAAGTGYALWSIWPRAGASSTVPVFPLLLGFKPDPRARLLLLAMLAGGLVALVHATSLVAAYLRRRTVGRVWVQWFAVLPFAGLALGLALPLIPLVAIVLLVLVPHGPGTRPPTATFDQLAAYESAVADAAVRDERKVYSRLVPITTANDDLKWRSSARDQLLVVTMVSTDDADRYYRTAEGAGRKENAATDRPRIWVTLAPELQRFCRRLGPKDPTDRVKQYLGIRPDAPKDWIVEMWVGRDELFRPCPDPEVTDSVCSLRSPDTPPEVKNIPDYRLFLESLYEQAYQRDRGMPWTGLGYTYDWSELHGIGASEYMLVPGAHYEVDSVQQTARYCAAEPGRP